MAWYKENVLWKVCRAYMWSNHAFLNAPSARSQIEKAFAAGYDPALELAKASAKKPKGEATSAIGDDELDWDADGPWTEHLRRQEQDLIDRIIRGNEVGHYFVLLGPKVRPGCNSE